MADVGVSTQVVPETLLSSEINNQAMVTNFKRALAQMRLDRLQLNRRRVALRKQIVAILESREELMAMFKNEAEQVYPELRAGNINAILAQVAAGHPLQQIWDKYQPKFGEFDVDIVALVKEYRALIDLTHQAKEGEEQTLENYASFAETATTEIPSVEQIEAELAQEEIIPVSDEADLVATITGLDLLSHDAQMALTSEVTDAEMKVYAESILPSTVQPAPTFLQQYGKYVLAGLVLMVVMRRR